MYILWGPQIALSVDVHLFGASLSTTRTVSKTEKKNSYPTFTGSNTEETIFLNICSFEDETTRRSAKGAPQKISADFLRGPQAFTGGKAAA